MLARFRNFYLTPRQYFIVAVIALAALVLIVFTGAAVRLTGSGLGCPDWPRCYGRVIAPVEFHALIEYGNRLLTGFVGFAVIAASVLAFRRRPFRRHLAIIGALLPLGVIAQAILGAIVVASHLAPELVIGHFILSMLLLDAAFALVWLARYESGERRRSTDARGVWAVRGLIPLGQLTIILGTMTTAAGPHAGAHEGELVQRFDFRGGETLSWMVERHSAMAAIFGLAAIGVLLYLRRPGGDRRAVRPLMVVLGLLAAQGLVGGLQWALELPAAIVWVHIAIATLTWVAMLWTIATAGLIAPRRAAEASAADPALADPAPASLGAPAGIAGR
ncbi:MAG TPA: COX15/CtaA family protein [Solirubrobacterales bacterium]|nr:COX15/CtaA family protein [Solirubrobacterales bacterium]